VLQLLDVAVDYHGSYVNVITASSGRYRYCAVV